MVIVRYLVIEVVSKRNNVKVGLAQVHNLPFHSAEGALLSQCVNVT